MEGGEIMGFLKRILSKTEIETGLKNQVLRQKAKPVKKITPAVLKIIGKMVKIVRENKYAEPGFINVGLAAPQIGHSLQIIVFKKWPQSDIMVLINPQIIWQTKNKMIMQESCLSLPQTTVSVKRSTRVTVQGLKPNGQMTEIRAKGFLARILQHELDHLNAVLISDRAKS